MAAPSCIIIQKIKSPFDELKTKPQIQPFNNQKWFYRLFLKKGSDKR